MIPAPARALGLALALGLCLCPIEAGLAFPVHPTRSGPDDPRRTASLASPAQDAGWNSPRARALMERAVRRRAAWTREGAPSDYQAEARGHIYFLFDLGRGTGRHLVKADQLALNLFWRQPGETRQVIVGRRERKILPTRIRYHIDHLTVVMDNFGDRIRLGEGSEVRDVLHPAAREAPGFYEYRLADSLALVMAGREIQVHRVEVRPRDPEAAGLVGSIYLDRATADIVRMDFTFTARSYLDPQLDYINVRLENALWGGRYWLPYRQGLELRRELRVLDFPAGGIIRAEFRVDGYRFDTDLPAGLFEGPGVSSLPRRVLRDYEFEQGLYDALDPEVATAPPSLQAIGDRATRIVAESRLRRANPLRLAVPGLSSVFRFRRAEGLYVGPGVSRTLAGRVDLRVLVGRAFGADRWEVSGSADAIIDGRTRLRLEAFENRTDDVAPWPASSGVVATLAALFDGDDYREPYWTRGVGLQVSRELGGVNTRLGLRWESWESARLGAEDLLDRGYRPVRRVSEGEVAILTAGAGSSADRVPETIGSTNWQVVLELAERDVAGEFQFVRGAAHLERFWPHLLAGNGLHVTAQAGGLAGGRPPAQRLFPLGGRGTVRGYPFHFRIGNLYGAVSLEARRELWYPFLSGSLFVDLGWAGLEGDAARRAAEVWNQQGDPAGPTPGVLTAAGVGVGLLFDIVRIEVARGLEREGIWEVIVRARPGFWSWL